MNDDQFEKLKNAYEGIKPYETDIWRLIHEHGDGRGLDSDFNALMKALDDIFAVE